MIDALINGINTVSIENILFYTKMRCSKLPIYETYL